MPFDSDVALLGTGVAPLVAATHLLSQGKSVLILNPDLDFFLEDSELSFDPMLPRSAATLNPERIKESTLNAVMAELRPEFPGAVEAWGAALSEGFHDPEAPHVRQRNRLWIGPTSGDAEEFAPGRELLEGAYVHASDANLNPALVEGLQALKRFPGVAQDRAPAFPVDHFHGLMIPNLCDVDVSRYRNGLLEFVRERLESEERVICSAAQIEPTPEGVRFHAGGSSHTARLADGMLVFWTPRLTSWILAQARSFETTPVWPKGMRLWEEWSLVSRDPIDPTVMGVFGDLAVWGEVEGAPIRLGAGLQRLAVLRAGSLLDPQESPGARTTLNWASQESFNALSGLCNGFMSWSRISLRGLKARSVLEWEGLEPAWRLHRSDSGSRPSIRVVGGADGPLFRVVRRARTACEELATGGARA